jgi:hypothetical protein
VFNVDTKITAPCIWIPDRRPLSKQVGQKQQTVLANRNSHRLLN